MTGYGPGSQLGPVMEAETHVRLYLIEHSAVQDHPGSRGTLFSRLEEEIEGLKTTQTEKEDRIACLEKDLRLSRQEADVLSASISELRQTQNELENSLSDIEKKYRLLYDSIESRFLGKRYLASLAKKGLLEELL